MALTPAKPRLPRVLIAATALTLTAAGAGTAWAGSHDQAAPAASKAKESHVTGDAWVKTPADRQFPYRRFIVDAHGGPWKIVNKKMVMGDARGTVRFNHYSPDKPGGPSRDHWNSIKVDYLMTGGPIAVVSGIQQGNVPANQKRATLTFYKSPLGHRYDRMGFSWGVVNAQCQQMGTGPAPFNPASAGPDGRWLKGYTVKDAPLQVPAEDSGVQRFEDPADCTFGDAPAK